MFSADTFGDLQESGELEAGSECLMLAAAPRTNEDEAARRIGTTPADIAEITQRVA